MVTAAEIEAPLTCFMLLRYTLMIGHRSIVFGTLSFFRFFSFISMLVRDDCSDFDPKRRTVSAH